MRRVIATAFCAWMAAAPAQASGINLSWDDCGTAGSESKTFACDTNVGPGFMLVASFIPPAGLTTVTAETIAIDIGSDLPVIPYWWRFKTTGSCREMALNASSNFISVPMMTCSDYWSTNSSGGVGSYITPYYGAACRARLTMVFAVPTTSAGPVDETQEYYACRLVISRAKTLSDGACGGCAEPITLQLQEIGLYQLAGMGNARLSWPKDNITVAWQSEHPNSWRNCLFVPTRNATWGAVKSLYR